MTREGEKFLDDLLTKIADAKRPQLIPEIKYIPIKMEEPKPKFEDVVINKEPDIKPKIETFFQDIKPKAEIFFPDVKPKIETFFKDIKPKVEIFFQDLKPKIETFFLDIMPKTETFFPDIKPKTEIFLPEIKPAIEAFPLDDWLDNYKIEIFDNHDA